MQVRIVLPLLLAGLCQSAFAGQYVAEMEKCVTGSITPAEAKTLAQWVFAGMAENPVVKGMANVSTQQGDALNRKVAVFFFDLKDRRCQREIQQAEQFEGRQATSQVYGRLMQSVIESLAADPAVGQYLGGIDKYADHGKLKK